MAHGGSGFEKGYDVSEFVASTTPIDEDAAAMRELFGYMRQKVEDDIEAYTGGKYDAEHDLYASMALRATELSSRNDYHIQEARSMLDPARFVLANSAAMRRAYDVVETIEIMNMSPHQADDPAEAWGRGLNVAATERMRREMERIKVAQRARAVGRFMFSIGL